VGNHAGFEIFAEDSGIFAGFSGIFAEDSQKFAEYFEIYDEDSHK
jgi:hypothetical protein